MSTQVIGQLKERESPPRAIPVQTLVTKSSFQVSPAFWTLLFGLSLIGGLVFFFLKQEGSNSGPAVVEKQPVPARIRIPAGEHILPDGSTVRLAKGILMGRTEVTISQYRDFLEAGDLEKYRHPDQPSSKKSHQPENWKKLWPTAVKNEPWEGRPLSTDCPVSGVDWWDAYAFAKWEGTRLPTLREWEIAAAYLQTPPGAAGWGPVGSSETDVTGAGLSDMAGNVREWTREIEINPAFQLSPKKPVSAGGSFQRSDRGVATRVWLDDRSIRAGDLGFRTVTEIEPDPLPKRNDS